MTHLLIGVFNKGGNETSTASAHYDNSLMHT